MDAKLLQTVCFAFRDDDAGASELKYVGEGFKIPHESFSGPLWGSTKPVQPPPPPAQT
ncbi:hypothetical protein PVAP13_3KG049594 [Panicum virgatum]|uniref:Uncharacterized protein n=1 Tax=Panicum virgatum TaxID=38727 RepID=A0A8T0UP73_PANVG|nr:hypothetical protein PVAP13_3KG049594 [Panicum virgatum]